MFRMFVSFSKGAGALVPLIWLAALLLGYQIGGAFYPDSRRSGVVGAIFACCLSGFGLIFLGYSLRRATGVVVTDPRTRRRVFQPGRHSYIFIPMHIWGFVTVIFFGLLSVLGVAGLRGERNGDVRDPAFDGARKERAAAWLPGEREFGEANKLITSRGDATYRGNDERAILMAQQMNTYLKPLADSIKEKSGGGASSIISLSQGDFLTYCHRGEEGVVFLIHVPKLRKFDQGSQELIGKGVWMIAQKLVRDSGAAPDQKIGIGLRGILLYGVVLKGALGEDDPRNVEDPSILYPFFAGQHGSGRAVEVATVVSQPKVLSGGNSLQLGSSVRQQVSSQQPPVGAVFPRPSVSPRLTISDDLAPSEPVRRALPQTMVAATPTAGAIVKRLDSEGRVIYSNR